MHTEVRGEKSNTKTAGLIQVVRRYRMLSERLVPTWAIQCKITVNLNFVFYS